MTRIGVVGLGYWGSKVVEEYVSLREEGEIDAVVACDIDQDRLSAIKNADERVSDVEEILPSIDGLHICTKSPSHTPIAMTAMDADVDVLVEKPMTVDSTDAFDLVEHASQTGRVLQTGHIFRFANIVRQLRHLVADDYFGEQYYYNIEWTHRIEPRFDEGVLWDLLTHPVDILNFVSDTWPEPVSGAVSQYRTDIDEAATVHLEGGGVTANIHVSWVDPVRRRTFQVVGEQRTGVAHCTDQRLVVHEDGESFEYGIKPNNTIRAEAENFVKAIRTGENQFNSAIVGARAVNLIENISNRIR